MTRLAEIRRDRSTPGKTRAEDTRWLLARLDELAKALQRNGDFAETVFDVALTEALTQEAYFCMTEADGALAALDAEGET